MQKITPFLWFENNAEEAIKFYASIFNNSRVLSIHRYPDGITEGPMAGMDGKVLTAIFELEGQRFMALDGGPYFKFNPTVSFTIIRNSASETEKIFNALLEGGMALMPLQKYPFSELYGWVQDRYGVSWQIGVGQNPEGIVPSLMFVGEHFGQAEKAIRFYTSLFKNASIKTLTHYGPNEHIEEGKVKYASFLLEGQPFIAMESTGHAFEASGAISFYVECTTQEEVDYYWNALIEGGDPKAQQCGWLKDKFGFSWQIIPKTLGELMSDPDKAKSGKVTQAMLQMKKIDIEGLRKAYEG